MKYTDLRTGYYNDNLVTHVLLNGNWEELKVKMQVKNHVKTIFTHINYITRLTDDIIVINYEDHFGEGDRFEILKIEEQNSQP